MRKSLLILVRGIPGSGKSYFTNALVDAIGSSNVVVLDPDATDYESEPYKAMVKQLQKEGVDEKFYPYRFLRERAHQGIEQGKIIIWNQAFMDLDGVQKTIRNLNEHAANHNLLLNVKLIEMEIDAELARVRIAERAVKGGHTVPDEKFVNFLADYRSFAPEGYDVTTIDGASDVRAAALLFAKSIGHL